MTGKHAFEDGEDGLSVDAPSGALTERTTPEHRIVRGYPTFRIPVPSEELADTYDRYIERRDRLAGILFEFATGYQWKDAAIIDPDFVKNYTADADEIIHTFTHLVPFDIVQAMPILAEMAVTECQACYVTGGHKTGCPQS